MASTFNGCLNLDEYFCKNLVKNIIENLYQVNFSATTKLPCVVVLIDQYLNSTMSSGVKA